MADPEQQSAMRYAEELVREFLLFRGFTSTLRAFEADLSSDLHNGFQVDRIIELFFSIYIPRFEPDKLFSLLLFLKTCFFSTHDSRYSYTIRKLETSLKRYYIVHALQKGRVDCVLDFFQRHGSGLLHGGDDWHAWFALPYIKRPHRDPRFQVYFSKEWLDTLVVSWRNFLSEIFNGIRVPALMKLSSGMANVRVLKKEVEKLSGDISQLQSLLMEKEEEISLLKRTSPGSSQHFEPYKDSESSSAAITEQAKEATVPSEDSLTSDLSGLTWTNISAPAAEDNPCLSSIGQERPACSVRPERENTQAGLFARERVANFDDANWEMKKPDCIGSIKEEGDFLEVSVESQESFSGHTSAISKCRFSASGANIASASVDGTVRIWNSDSASSTSRNATIYCGAKVLSLEWDYKSDRLLLIGTAERGIKAWNVDAKRVVCDLVTDTVYPRILDLKWSPVEPIFASAASSIGDGRQGSEALGFASVAIWNMKTWKPLTHLPLGEDPPSITSVCFNHNGKMLAAAATDGMVHLFDVYASLPITGWPAHDSPVSCVKFSPDQASIFSLGADGKVFEWSLHNQGQILQEQDASRFCGATDLEMPHHEMALDAQGKMLLLTSNSSSSPLYDLHGKQQAWRTLQHNAAITSVDWDPLRSRFLTGSADQSVRVTSINA